MTRPKDFDPQAIPHYNADGRVGELDPDEPEERQSSAQSEAGTEPLDPERGAGAPISDAARSDPPMSDRPTSDDGTTETPAPRTAPR